MLPLKSQSNFWRTLEMSSVNSEISLMLNWCANCLLVAGIAGNQNPTFRTADAKLYVLVVIIHSR